MRNILVGAFLGILALLVIGGGFIGGTAYADKKRGSADGHERRINDIGDRNDTMDRAVALYPLPRITNFPMREALVKYSQRQDLKNHPWYIYVANPCFQCPGGLAYQYYIGQTYPQSTCNFLSTTQDVDTRYSTQPTYQAPSIDGIFYGGAGSSGGGCDYFFFDIATDGLQVMHHDWLWQVSDHVLLLDAKLIQVQKP